MPRTFEEIAQLYEQRRSEDHPLIQAARELKDVYEGEVVIPLPELDRNEKAFVPNLIAVGVEEIGGRIASVFPNLFFPALDDQKERGKQSKQWARKRRQAVFSWLEENRIQSKRQRRSRWLVGYGIAPVMLRPWFEKEMPRWSVRDPLSTFPAPTEDPDDLVPPDVTFGFQRSLSWIRQNFFEETVTLAADARDNPDTKYEMVEYVDAEQWTLGVIARRGWTGGNVKPTPIHLRTVPNRTGKSWAVTPSRVTLTRRMGLFSQSIGMYIQQAKLMALENIAVEKAVFPDLVITGAQNTAPVINQGQGWFDGRSGIANVVTGAQAVQWLQMNPGMMTNNAIDRLERAQGITSHVPAEMRGESATNVRTGRRGQQIFSAVVDFPVAEAQQALAESLKEEVSIAIAIQKKYFGAVSKSYHVSFPKAKGKVDYTANVHFETDAVEVSQPFAGTDLNALAIRLQGKLATGLISTQTARRLDPEVDDDEFERDQNTIEALEQGVLAEIQQPGSMPIPVKFRIAELVSSGKAELMEAVKIVQEEEQRRQAEAAQGMVSPEQLQPGIAPPGTPASPIPEAPEGVDRLENILMSLSRPPQAFGRATGGAPMPARAQ